jgi:hypothetical protein
MVGQLRPMVGNFRNLLPFSHPRYNHPYSSLTHTNWQPMRWRNRFGFALLTFSFLILAIVTPFWQIEQTLIDYVLHVGVASTSLSD